MKKIPLRQYAVQNRMSLFEVVRKIQRGELASESVEEDGKTVQYVLVPDETERSDSAGSDSDDAEISAPVPGSSDALLREIRMLRREIERLHATIVRCCGERITQAPERVES
ncbi:hypothetical protein [Nitratifractor sp.]